MLDIYFRRPPSHGHVKPKVLLPHMDTKVQMRTRSNRNQGLVSMLRGCRLNVQRVIPRSLGSKHKCGSKLPTLNVGRSAPTLSNGPQNLEKRSAGHSGFFRPAISKQLPTGVITLKLSAALRHISWSKARRACWPLVEGVWSVARAISQSRNVMSDKPADKTGEVMVSAQRVIGWQNRKCSGTCASCGWRVQMQSFRIIHAVHMRLAAVGSLGICDIRFISMT